MEKHLHHRPNLAHLRGQAKQLLASLRAGDSAAAQTFIDHLPVAAGLNAAQVREKGFRLADAQSAIARQSGFAGWPNVARHVETLRGMEGSWDIVNLVLGGRDFGDTGDSRILMDGDRFRMESPTANYEGEFSIDVEVTPHQIDIEFVEGPEAGNWSYGIFKLDGDVMTICLGLTGFERPTEFVSPEESGIALETLHRTSGARPESVTGGIRSEKEADEPASRAASPGEITEEHRRLEGEWAATHLVRNGQEMPAEWLPVGKRIGSGVSTKVIFGGQVMVDADTRIDASKTPIEIDYFLRNGTTQLGIMEWTDEGVRFCFAAPGDPRPDSFESAAGSKRTLSAWRKA